jgi:cyclase
LIVDDQYAPMVPKIQDAIKTVTDKPVRFVLSTHWHGDHTGGNEQFAKAKAEIIAHENVRKRMETGSKVRGTMVPPAPKVALPIVTFDRTLTVHINGEDIRALHFAKGHTDGDSIIFFTKANVVHMGDVFIAPAASFGENSNGGSILALIEALKFVLPQIPADAKVVPSHGAISSRSDVARGLEILTAMKAIVEAGIAAGKTKEQMIAEKPFDQWKGSVAWFIPPGGYVADFYQELTAPKK